MNMPMHIMAKPIQTAAETESGADFSAAEIIRQNHYCSSAGVDKPETALALKVYAGCPRRLDRYIR
jgi:hypothetical protein